MTDTDKIQQFENDKRLFMRLVSHNLRSPLASMLSCLRVLATGAIADPADVKKLTDNAAARGDDMMNMLNDMIALFETGVEAELPLEEIDVENVVKETAAQFLRKASAQSIEIALSFKDAGKIMSRRKLFNNVVKNLLDNAIKYSNPGEKAALDVGRDGGRLMIAATDRGLVIKPEDFEFIGKEFWRAGSAKQHDEHGTGLGIANVKAVLKILDGSLEISSSEENGTIFKCSFPAE